MIKKNIPYSLTEPPRQGRTLFLQITKSVYEVRQGHMMRKKSQPIFAETLGKNVGE